LIVVLLALPASVMGAPPANDKFASRQVLGPGFPGGAPIEVTGDNFEAGEEEGEFIPGLSPAGHSVWFEWEASGDGWVSVGVCDSEFPTLIGVFTGADVKTLTPVTEGNGSEGPDCPYQGRQYTFFAASGIKYVIAVDGYNFFPPGGTPPVTEGEFELVIKETPVPPNDEFENATKLTGSISEEPGGNRLFFANVRGYNWTASIEHGEPEEATTGASVWYSFTAPEEATYNFGLPCCQTAFNLKRDLYSGDAVDELTLLAGASETGKLDLAAGETVRIRVSGPIEEGSEEPKVANFDFNVSAQLEPKPSPPSGGDPPASPPPPAPVADTTAPQTTIDKRYLAAGTAKFWFSANEGASFLCRLDKGDFKPCSAPRSYKHLKAGKHTFKVKAVDAAGNVDQAPAIARFQVAPRPKRSR
jgi:hypothetical protein